VRSAIFLTGLSSAAAFTTQRPTGGAKAMRQAIGTHLQAAQVRDETRDDEKHKPGHQKPPRYVNNSAHEQLPLNGSFR
jgi:hypothetical protein